MFSFLLCHCAHFARLCVFVPVFMSEWITVAKRPLESLSTHPRQRAASVTETSIAQAVTIPPSYLLGAKVKGIFLPLTLSQKKPPHAHITTHKQTHRNALCFSRLQTVCEPEEVLVPALPETACVERGYITPQQAYNLLNAEEGHPALHDPYYILILDCRNAKRWVLWMQRLCHINQATVKSIVTSSE